MTEDTTILYMVYRRCVNWEAGDVLFVGQPLLWFDSLPAARAVYNQSGEQARDGLVDECSEIRRNESLEFTSGYTWATILFGFSRERHELPGEARVRVEGMLRDASDSDIVERLRAAVVAADGGELVPTHGSHEATVRAMDLDRELDELAEYLS